MLALKFIHLVVKMEKHTRYFEGCGREGPINCIFLTEFHHTAGPKITCQVSGYQASILTNYIGAELDYLFIWRTDMPSYMEEYK